MARPDYNETLLQETRDELARADGKASILLAASGIALAALLSSGTDASWYPRNLSSDFAEVCVWVALALLVLGVVVVGAAVKPRLRARRPKRGKPHYFADVEAYWPRWWQLRSRVKLCESGRQSFSHALGRLSADEHDERVEEQIWVLSHIAYRKYRLIGAAMLLYAIALVVGIVALAVEMQWV